jgi:hypothetical protein
LPASFQTPILGSVEHKYEASVRLCDNISGLVVEAKCR